MNGPVSGTPSAKKTLLAAIILISLTLLAYSNTFNAPFVFDDILIITYALPIRMTQLTPETMARVLTLPYRPLANLSFAANYYLHGYDVRGYHAVNLIIHIITALLVGLVTRQTLRRCHYDNTAAPFFAAALWLANPLHTQSVTYTVQRMNSLAAMFYMLALFCYIAARTKTATEQGCGRSLALYTLCLIAGLLGLASKEIIVTLPVMILMYEWYFFRDLNPTWLKKQLPLMGLAALTLIALIILYLRGDLLDHFRGLYRTQTFTMGQRLLTEAGVVVYYLSLLLFPHPARLTLLYDFPLSRGLSDPFSTVLAVAALFALLVAAVYSAKKHRLLSFAILWFLTTLAIESSVLGLALIYEHRTYLPSVFPVIGLTALWMKPPRPGILSAAILCALIAVCGAWTYQRNLVWNDVLLFWRDNAAKSPKVAEVNNNLGQALLGGNESRPAEACFRKAIKLDPGLEAARVNLGVALQRLGQVAQSIAQYQEILAINPENIEARFNLAMQLKNQGRTEEAIAQLKKIIALDPSNTGTMLNLGVTLMEQQKNDQALAWFRKAAALDASDTRILNNLGVVLHRLGRTGEAMDAYRQGLALDRHNPLLHNSLGLALMACDQYEPAARHFQLALTADPGLTEACHNLGLAAELQGEISRAINYYRRALGLSPEYDLSRYNLAALFLKTGQPDRAIALLRNITAVQPEHGPALNRLLVALADAQELRQAAALAEKMAAAAPDDPAIYYNLACLYARQKDSENAVACLKKAVDLGYDRWNHLKTDPDLENIRDTEYFKNLVR